MEKEVMLNEMDNISIQELIDKLSTSYIKLIENRVDLKLFPSVMLWGQPGVGKSQAIHQIAKKIEMETYKKVNICEVRLLLFNPIDLRGIPVANEDKTLAVWLKPKIFQMDNSSNVINILFLDEISAAPQSVQSAAYQITLDRTVGEHKLPDNCIVIAAGNRVSDKSVAYKMPKALANRLMHFDISTSFESWKKWALHNNIHPLIIGFLASKPELLNTFDASKENLAFATPRSWEMVSNVLNYISDDINESYSLIAGLIGSGIAYELKAWDTVYRKLPNVEDIFKGRVSIVPKNASEIYSLCGLMINYLKRHKSDYQGIVNSITYATRFPKEFSLLLMEEYLGVDPTYKTKLLAIPEFSRWLNLNGSMLNGKEHGIFK